MARLQIAQGRLDEAQQRLARVFEEAIAAGRMGRVIGICSLQAVAFRAQGKTAQALDSLSYALSLAEPEGYVGTFIDEGEPMAALLRELRSAASPLLMWRNCWLRWPRKPHRRSKHNLIIG